VYYVQHGGFDTHSGQGGAQGRHGNLLNQFSAAVQAFYKDLKTSENDGRVLTMSFSEFGRRVGQNASQGTDHGTAAPMFLFGPMIRPGIIGDHPSLTDLDEGDLKYKIDFRTVYAGSSRGGSGPTPRRSWRASTRPCRSSRRRDWRARDHKRALRAGGNPPLDRQTRQVVATTRAFVAVDGSAHGLSSSPVPHEGDGNRDGNQNREEQREISTQLCEGMESHLEVPSSTRTVKGVVTTPATATAKNIQSWEAVSRNALCVTTRANTLRSSGLKLRNEGDSYNRITPRSRISVAIA
jgi:hypothetical protein